MPNSTTTGLGQHNTGWVIMSLLNIAMRRCRSFLSEEDGPTAVEYAVMLALIVVVCAGTVSTLARATNENFNRSAQAILDATN